MSLRQRAGLAFALGAIYLRIVSEGLIGFEVAALIIGFIGMWMLITPDPGGLS